MYKTAVKLKEHNIESRQSKYFIVQFVRSWKPMKKINNLLAKNIFISTRIYKPS